MLWIEPCYMFYSGIAGGLVGATAMAITMRRYQSEYISRMEHFWNNDIKGLRSKIDELSTKKVDKVVHKPKKSNIHRGYKYQRHFDH